MASFTHKGVEITLMESTGRFVATVNGKREFSPSLAAMQKKIDKVAEEAFEPFTALRERRYDDKCKDALIVVKIIRKDKPGRGRYERGGFVDEAGRTYGSKDLLPNNQTSRDLFAAWEAAQQAAHEADKAKRAARDALPFIEFTA